MSVRNVLVYILYYKHDLLNHDNGWKKLCVFLFVTCERAWLEQTAIEASSSSYDFWGTAGCIISAKTLQ